MEGAYHVFERLQAAGACGFGDLEVVQTGFERALAFGVLLRLLAEAPVLPFGRDDGTDEDGRLYITGRSKEVVVLGSGKNIYPEEIEAHYARSPFIDELCVVGLSRPGSPAAERLHALVRPDRDAMRARGAVNVRELIRFEIERFGKAVKASGARVD